MSDKYDFASALQYATAQWLQACGGQSMLDAGILMTSALLFGDADAFARLTFTLIDKLELARSAAVELGHAAWQQQPDVWVDVPLRLCLPCYCSEKLPGPLQRGLSSPVERLSILFSSPLR